MNYVQIMLCSPNLTYKISKKLSITKQLYHLTSFFYKVNQNLKQNKTNFILNDVFYTFISITKQINSKTSIKQWTHTRLNELNSIFSLGNFSTSASLPVWHFYHFTRFARLYNFTNSTTFVVRSSFLLLPLCQVYKIDTLPQVYHFTNTLLFNSIFFWFFFKSEWNFVC